MMKTEWKSILAAATIAAPIAAGCVMVVDPDMDDHYVEECSDCHVVVVYDKTVMDSTAFRPGADLSQPCLRTGI